MSRLRIQRRPVAQLSPSEWDTLWRFAQDYTEGSEEAFRRSLQSKRYVVLIEKDARLAGLGAVDIYPISHQGSTIYIIYSGNLLFAPGLRGQSIVQREGFRAYLETKLRHPLSQVWLFYDTFSYKTYLMLPNNFEEYWPRYDRPTPPDILDLLDRLGAHRYGPDWDPERGICRRGQRRLKEGVASISPELRAENPHVRFFYERNPGYDQGDMLAVLIPLGARNWLQVLRRALQRARRAR